LDEYLPEETHTYFTNLIEKVLSISLKDLINGKVNIIEEKEKVVKDILGTIERTI
jgi:hypothetical protein